MKGTIEAFLEVSDGDLTKPVDSKQFVQALLGRDVDDSFMRKFFNAFHSTCPNFKAGEDDCPDCWEKHLAGKGVSA